MLKFFSYLNVYSKIFVFWHMINVHPASKLRPKARLTPLRSATSVAPDRTSQLENQKSRL